MQERFMSDKSEESCGASVVATLGLLAVGTEEDDEMPCVNHCNNRDCSVENPEKEFRALLLRHLLGRI
jgi:hypothetical protein